MASILCKPRHPATNKLLSLATALSRSLPSLPRYSSAPRLSADLQEGALDKSGWLANKPSLSSEAENAYERLVFLGCPGVGKGTYASRLARFIGVPHIAMGDLVRNELRCGSPLASQMEAIMKRGGLLPDEIVFDLLARRLSEGSKLGESGFILDGFPRNTAQAEVLDGMTSIDVVVNLKLREDVLVTKCLGRRTCSECGGNFNIADINFEAKDGLPPIVMPPLPPPSSCLSKMVQRADDTAEVVKARLTVYNAESRPVEGYYRKKGVLLDFDVLGGIPETWPRLLTELNLSEADKQASDDESEDEKEAA